MILFLGVQESCLVSFRAWCWNCCVVYRLFSSWAVCRPKPNDVRILMLSLVYFCVQSLLLSIASCKVNPLFNGVQVLSVSIPDVVPRLIIIICLLVLFRAKSCPLSGFVHWLVLSRFDVVHCTLIQSLVLSNAFEAVRPWAVVLCCSFLTYTRIALCLTEHWESACIPEYRELVQEIVCAWKVGNPNQALPTLHF